MVLGKLIDQIKHIFLSIKILGKEINAILIKLRGDLMEKKINLNIKDKWKTNSKRLYKNNATI